MPHEHAAAESRGRAWRSTPPVTLRSAEWNRHTRFLRPSATGHHKCMKLASYSSPSVCLNFWLKWVIGCSRRLVMQGNSSALAEAQSARLTMTILHKVWGHHYICVGWIPISRSCCLKLSRGLRPLQCLCLLLFLLHTYSPASLQLLHVLTVNSSSPLPRPSSFRSQEDAVPALMILKSALMLLLLMASRQAEITWFLGLPTAEKHTQRQIRLIYHLLSWFNWR